MRRIDLALSAFVIATSLTACSNSVEESQPTNSKLDAIAQPTPTCSSQEFTKGSDWIEGQLRAFKDTDAEKAYSYASENFRRSNSVEAFAAIIVSQYTMLLDLKDYQIVSCDKNGELFIFKVNISDNQGNSYAMEYMLSRNGEKWGIDGASVTLKVS